MNNKRLSYLSSIIGIGFILNAPALFAASQQIITTNPDQCDRSGNQTISVSGGTTQAVIDSSVSQWQSLGFSLGQISPNKDIIVCTSGKGVGSNTSNTGGGGSNITVEGDSNIIDTVEKEGLAQTASIASVAINASVIQMTNVFTRLASIRRQNQVHQFQPPLGQSFNLPVEDQQKKKLGGGASADESSLLDQRLNLFINGNGGFGQQEITKRSRGFNFDNLGTTLGVDYRLTDHWVLGTALGYTANHTNMNRGLGQLDSDSYSLSAFSGYSSPNSLYIDALARVGWNNYNSQRNFTSVTNASRKETAYSNYAGNDYSVSLGAGYHFVLDSFSLRPLIRYDYIHNDINGFQETGARTGLIKVNGQHIDSMRSAIGTELSYVVNTSYAILVPMMRAEWQHEFMNDSRLLTAFQLNSSGTRRAQQLATNSPDRDFVNLGFGFSAALPRGISGFFYYETMLANSLTTSHAFNGGIRIEF